MPSRRDGPAYWLRRSRPAFGMAAARPPPAANVLEVGRPSTRRARPSGRAPFAALKLNVNFPDNPGPWLADHQARAAVRGETGHCGSDGLNRVTLRRPRPLLVSALSGGRLPLERVRRGDRGGAAGGVRDRSAHRSGMDRTSPGRGLRRRDRRPQPSDSSLELPRPTSCDISVTATHRPAHRLAEDSPPGTVVAAVAGHPGQ